MTEDYIAKAERVMASGDDLLSQIVREGVEKIVKKRDDVNATQHGIIKYMEGMAQVLAEAGRASYLATGDQPRVALEKWLAVVRMRALELLESEKNVQRGKPNVALPPWEENE